MDACGVLVAKALRRRWDRDMNVRRRNFMGYKGRGVLRVSKSYVDFDTGRLRRPANVHNIFADDILVSQIEGGVRRPEKARKLYVPIQVGGRMRRHRKGKISYYKDSRGRSGSVVAFSARKRGPDRAVAVLTPKVVIPRRFRVRSAVASVQKRMKRVYYLFLRKELRRVLPA